MYDDRHIRASELNIKTFEDSLAHALHLHDHADPVVAELHYVLADSDTRELVMEELAVEKEPGTAHEPGHRGSAGVVHQQRCVHALHEHGGELHTPTADYR